MQTIPDEQQLALIDPGAQAAIASVLTAGAR